MSASIINSDHATPYLIQLDTFKQCLKIAVTETFIALALNNLEKYGAEHIFREDLEQDSLLLRIAVDQDAVFLQPVQIFAMTGHPLVHQFIIGIDRILQAYATRT